MYFLEDDSAITKETCLEWCSSSDRANEEIVSGEPVCCGFVEEGYDGVPECLIRAGPEAYHQIQDPKDTLYQATTFCFDAENDLSCAM